MSGVDISILIPTMYSRYSLFKECLANITKQISECPEIRVEVLHDMDNCEKTLGAKRNDLVARATGKYCAFIYDDDIISPVYLRSFVPMILSTTDYDCATLTGAYYHKGDFKKLFHHSLETESWSETPDAYLRNITPINLMKTSIARQVQYSHIQDTKGLEFSLRLAYSRLLKTEFKIDTGIPLYHYIDGLKGQREKWTYIWDGNYLKLFPKYSLLIKFPSRNRAEILLKRLREYVDYAENMSTIKILVTIDLDDKTNDVDALQSIHSNIIIHSGDSLNKIHAINRDMDKAGDYEIILLASDDMVPLKKGYDTTICKKMLETYPDTDGALWFNDGYQDRINTLVIIGKKYYDRFGFIYNPVYKSVYCDNEFTDVAKKLNKITYFDEVIIRHEHPGNSSEYLTNSLYLRNAKYWDDDEYTYYYRNSGGYAYDISVLVCTIPSRATMFAPLICRLSKLINKLSIKVEILCDDRVGVTIGKKRNDMVHKAKGRYCCFIDDDDNVTDDYFEEYDREISKGSEWDCFSLSGKYFSDGVYVKTFLHSTDIPTWHETPSTYMRGINHLNLIKTIIARSIGYEDMTHGEDMKYSNKLMASKRIKTQFSIDHPTYLYYFVSKPDNTITNAANILDSVSTLGLNFNGSIARVKTFSLFGQPKKR